MGFIEGAIHKIGDNRRLPDEALLIFRKNFSFASML